MPYAKDQLLGLLYEQEIGFYCVKLLKLGGIYFRRYHYHNKNSLIVYLCEDIHT